MISRPTYQAQAIDHLQTSIKLNSSSPTAWYHLAYCQAEARQIRPATESIRTTLELDSSNVQAWHLLCLLLTAQGDWKSAVTAGEAGVGVWESAEEESEEMLSEQFQIGVTVVDQDPTVESKDFALTSSSPTPSPETSSSSPPKSKSSTQPSHILLSSGYILPLPLTPLTMPIPKSKRLEQVIQLRMTLNVITEKVSGAEQAMLRQQELFAFFSARSGRNRLGRGASSILATGTGGSPSFVGTRERERQVSGVGTGAAVGTGPGLTLAPGDGNGLGAGIVTGKGGGNAGLGDSYVAVNETAPGPPGLGESMVSSTYNFHRAWPIDRFRSTRNNCNLADHLPFFL